jgi:FkbM family methyltransferase
METEMIDLTHKDSSEIPHETVIREIYVGLLGREPDTEGLKNWISMIESGMSPGEVLEAIISSDEYKTKLFIAKRHELHKKNLSEAVGSAFEIAPFHIVDIGAQELENGKHVYAPIIEHKISHKIVGFEPLDERRITKVDQGNENFVTLLSTFIGDGEPQTFHINNFDATSSLLPLNTKLIKEFVDLSELVTVKTEPVKTTKLDLALPDTFGVDFLKLDIQGFEFSALLHASSVLERTNVIHCEVSFFEIYQNQALFSEIETFLRSKDFYFVDFSSSCHYPYHCPSKNKSRDRLGWCDAVFFKKIDKLETERDFLAQIIVSLLVYNKPTIAEFLAKELDSKFQKSFVEIFQ